MKKLFKKHSYALAAAIVAAVGIWLRVRTQTFSGKTTCLKGTG
jgi:hypothetical protein